MATDTLVKLAAGAYLEGLAVDVGSGIVWYSDVIGGGVHGVDADGRRTSLNPERKFTGGVYLNADGALLSSGPGGIRWNHPVTGRSGWLLREIEGQAVNGVNEMIADGEGGLIFGTCDLERVIAGGQPRPTALYHLAIDGGLRLLADDVGFANGMMLDSHRHRFYCNDTFNGTLVFDVGPGPTLGNRRLLLKKPDADGMALDAAGNLWITGFQSSHIERLSPEGEVLDAFDTPVQGITQVRFGGDDLRDLYITTVAQNSAASLKDGDFDGVGGSVLYRGRSDVAGMPVAPTRFALVAGDDSDS